MRHVAVHRTHDHEKNTSDWILIHCPQYLESGLIEALKSDDNEIAALDFVLAGTLQNWRDYVNYLESEISALVS